MTITEVKPEYVLATIQKLADGERLYCIDFAKAELHDAEGLTIGYLQRMISSGVTRFYKVGE